MSPTYYYVVKFLKSASCEPSIIINRADIGRVTVVLDKSDNFVKALNLLNASIYEVLKKDIIPSIQRKLNSLIVKLRKDKSVDSTLAKSQKLYRLSPYFL